MHGLPGATSSRPWDFLQTLLAALLSLLTTAVFVTLTTESAQAATRTFTGIGLTANGQGYMLASSAGEFYAYGTAHAWPNPTGFNGTITGVAITADGQGALAVSSAGQLYAYGTAHAWPNPTGFTHSITSVAMTANGQGAVAMSDTGQFYAYGTVRPQQNPTQFTGTMVEVKVTADGQGLVAMSSSGQIYAYGTARWLGNGDPGTSTTAGEAAKLAQQILSLQAAGKIRIADFSEKPDLDKGDRSLASQQLRDIADGKPAQLSRRCFSSPPAPVQPDIRVLQFSADLGQQDGYTMNVLFGQCHATNSAHYRGKAADFACPPKGHFDTSKGDSVGAKYGVKRNSETCAANGHWHYSTGGT